MNMKKLFSLIMALLMAFSMVAVAEEVEDEDEEIVVAPRAVYEAFELTIKDTIVTGKAADGSNVSVEVDREFLAYQIFAGTLQGDAFGVTGWGTGVMGANLLAALQAADDTFGVKNDEGETVNPFDSCTSAAAVAAVVASHSERDRDWLNAFADIVAHNTSASEEGFVTHPNYTWPSLPVGYYLIDEVTDFAEKGAVMPDNYAYSRYMLKLTSDTIIEPKDVVPELHKKIVEGENRVTITNGAVGDTVNFELTSKVPDMTGYDSYWFIVHDTMSKGLTFKDDVAIKIGDTTLTADQFEVIDTVDETTGVTTIQIAIKNFINFKAQSGATIVITYSATINENAVEEDKTEENTAHLEYSNDPDETYDGYKPNPDGPNPPTGETPDETVKVYVTEIVIDKVDGKTNEKLANAVITLTGTKLNTSVITGVQYVLAGEEDVAPFYWLLKDGTYTTVDPSAAGVDTSVYADTTKKYVSKNTTQTVVGEGENISFTATTDANGHISFDGLAAGTYYIEEIVAPDGYNLLLGKIKVEIIFNNGTWSYKINDGEEKTMTEPTVTVKVENNKGSSLPSTGGMGTTMLYVGGGILMMAAFVLIVSKRRATAE